MQELTTSLTQWWASIAHPAWVLSAAWGVYLLLLAGWIVLQKREPVATLGWILGLAALPLVGFIVYYVFGLRRIRRQRLQRARAHLMLSPHLPTLDPGTSDSADIARLAHAVTGLSPTTATSLQLLEGGARTFDSLLEAISAARHHVHLEYYIFEPGEVGIRVRDTLAARARAGVKVRMLLDAVGSAASSARFLAPLRASGVELAWFHPFLLRWIRRPRLNLRNHRKLVVIDGAVAFTGGINVCDTQDERIRADAYQDLHLRLEGNVVRALQLCFLEDWAYATGVALRDARLWPPAPAGPTPVVLLPDGPDSPWQALHRVAVDAITRADHRVWLVTPYFVPTEAALQALTSAALRGVDVRLMVPQRSDSRVVTCATRSYYDDLLSAGVRVFEYLPRMLHTKAMIVDSDVALLGSANFDHRSFRLNFELSLLLFESLLVDQLEALFRADLLFSREVPGDRRPGFPQRLAEAGARLLSPLL